MKTNESTTMRIKKDVHALAKKAAEKDGRDLSNWLRFLANRETERIESGKG